MRVNVKLFSRFREHLPPEAKGEASLDLPEETTVADLLDHLGIEGRVQLIAVNDEPDTDMGRALHNGDEVRIFPVVVGG